MADENSPTNEEPVSQFSDKEVLRRVRGLIALGNSPKVSELILLQAGATPEQVKKALAQIQQEAQVEGKEQNYLGWIIVLVSILLVLLGLYVWQNWPVGNEKAPEASTSNSGNPLDAFIQSLLAGQDIPPVNDLPEPHVEFDETGKEAVCPRNANEAASLFGGGTGTWTYQTEAKGWLYYDNVPGQLTIPANMSGSLAHGSARSPKFMPMIGPVRVSNAHLAFILCP